MIDENDTVNVLGLHWNTTEDRLYFIPKSLELFSSSVTKRSILQDSARIYDPLGILSPVTIRAKLLIQELWQQSVEWDELLDKQMTDKWRDIATDLRNATMTSISRRYFPTDLEGDNPTEHPLHIFADASMKAYGAVVYICEGNIASFVIAKTRVAPIKQLTLPQLELMAALVATRLGKLVVDSLSNHYNFSVHLWSDSQVVLHWIHSEKKLKQFVTHRVEEISQTFPISLWRCCPTGDNPADLLTRGTTSTTLSNSLWINGPAWLTDDSKWPQWNPSATVLHLQADTMGDDILTPISPTEPIPGIHQIIDISRYNSLSKLLHVTGYVLRFITNLRDSTSKQTGPLSVQELSTAEFKWMFSC